jgi:methyl-accepting chemotaxis protein
MTESNGTNNPLTKSLTILTEQIGRLTEVVNVGFADMKEGMTELRTLVREQSDTSKRQEQNISRLVDTVSRQSEMVEALLRDRQ